MFSLDTNLARTSRAINFMVVTGTTGGRRDQNMPVGWWPDIYID